MSLPAVPPNPYTDAPKPHSNLILGSLQLLFWLLFHPSAWRNHIARIDSTLRPDFWLIELSRAQWRNPALRRLLIQGYVVWPLLGCLLVGLELLVLGESGRNIAFDLAFGVASGVVVSMANSVAVGVTLGVVYAVGNAVAKAVATSIAFGVTGGLAFGMAGSVVFGVARQKPTYSLAKQIGGVVVGVLIGSLVTSATNRVAYSVTGNVVVRLTVRLAVVGAAYGLTGGVAFGWRRGLAFGWRRGLAFGVAYAMLYAIALGMAHTMAGDVTLGWRSGLANGAWFSASFALPYVLAERIAGSIAGAVAGALGGGGWWIAIFSTLNSHLWPTLPLCLMSILLGLTQTRWRPVVLYPVFAAWNILLYRADQRRLSEQRSWSLRDRFTFLRWHSAFWDEFQRLPLLGLEDHVVLVAEHNPAEARAAIEYLSTSRQRWAARAAQIELDARSLERCTDVKAISNAQRSLAAGELEGPASALLRSFSRISQDADAALNQESAYNQRLALRAVSDRLDGLLRELTRSSDKYAIRFRPIATRWCQVVTNYVDELAQAVELRQEIDSPYIIGVPLTEEQEIFVGRTHISARIEQLLLDRRRPPLLLYGQRRMGKTSLLNNLGRLLPSTIIPLFVDLQGPTTRANDYTGFLYNIARGMVNSAQRHRNLNLPPLTRELLAADPFTCFDEWLDDVEQVLGQNTALLALDEFEALDSAISRGRFDEDDVLGMLRNLLQHRPRFKVLLSGSHTLEEFQRWASYLINVQVVQISYLNPAEARQLIEQPVMDFALRYEPDAVERVLNLTRCHPFLVQLLCAEIVALKNEQNPAVRRLATLADVEAAVPEALSSGSFFFADIQRNQVDAAGLALLRFLAALGQGAIISREALYRQFSEHLDSTLDLLLRRDLIEPAGDGYLFQVELIRRWFAKQA